MGEDETAEALSAAAESAAAEHNAATALQRVWLGRVGRQQQLRALFRQYDFDDSGSLEREEVSALLRKLGAAEELKKLDGVMAAMVAALGADIARIEAKEQASRAAARELRVRFQIIGNARF